MKVLIVDNSLQIVRRLEELLLTAISGVTVASSSSYENGRQLLKELEPDVVLLGISLPENESLQLLVEIKSAVYSSTVIVLSANTNPLFYQQCSLQGAHHFLDKYYEFEKIPDLINAITDAGKTIS
jgi:DNA-binding NarL/FixJ family response regulator